MLLELKHIYKNYLQDKIVIPVLKDVNISIDEGEYVAIMGPSGSGKTTLMNIIGCLDRPTKGEFLLEGESIVDYNENRLSDLRLNTLGSGGQQQRVAIARALVNNPKIILADEPTGALDSRSGIQVMNLFQQLNEEGVTIIMITHDANIANHAKKVLHIFDGEIVEDKARKEKEKQQSEIRSEAAESVSSELEKDFGVNAWEGEI